MGDTSEARDRPCLQVLLKQGSALETNTLTMLHQNLLWPVCSLGIACRGCLLFLSDGMCEEGTEQSAGRGPWPRRSLWKWDLSLREPQKWDPQIPSLSPELSSCKQLCTQLQANVPPFGKPARRATEQFQSTLPLQSANASQSACASAWPSAGGTRWIVWIRRNVIKNSIGFSSLAQAATRECSPLNAARPFPSLRVSQHLHLTCLPTQTCSCWRTALQAGGP